MGVSISIYPYIRLYVCIYVYMYVCILIFHCIFIHLHQSLEEHRCFSNLSQFFTFSRKERQKKFISVEKKNPVKKKKEMR